MQGPARRPDRTWGCAWYRILLQVDWLSQPRLKAISIAWACVASVERHGAMRVAVLGGLKCRCKLLTLVFSQNVATTPCRAAPGSPTHLRILQVLRGLGDERPDLHAHHLAG